jgi:hypothetical protein
MLPNMGDASLPRGFSPQAEDSPISSSGGESISLEEATINAQNEWMDLRRAFDELASRFGEDFDPLGPEYATEIQSPFGPAIQYRTYHMAIIWLWYWMGIIVCQRAHPAMPPVAMMAAGIMAQQTAQYVIKIGRICAGIAPDIGSADQINITTGSALTESAFALFVAGVQVSSFM